MNNVTPDHHLAITGQEARLTTLANELSAPEIPTSGESTLHWIRDLVFPDRFRHHICAGAHARSFGKF
ncbi:MAG: hypothetical protein H7A51_04355 [Akkermansiaceae bacterium]|nr:hypothetical protein [Akkermansiaceae bacterium]